MRIIDTHTHLPGNLIGAPPRSAAEIRDEFEQDGLRGAWIFTTDGLFCGSEGHNDILADAVKDDLDFFIPFCTVSPHSGIERALRELKRCKNELGMRGLKLHPWLQSFSLSHAAVIPVFREAGALGMPVVLHDGTPPYSTPLQIAAAAEQSPETTVILGHSGLDDLYSDAIIACLRHPNVYLCLLGPSAGHMEEIIQRCPVEKLLFGSDGGFGMGLVRSCINKVLSACDDKEVLSRIFSGNAESILQTTSPSRHCERQ